MGSVHFDCKRFKNAPTERVDPSRVRQGWVGPGDSGQRHTAPKRVCRRPVRPRLGRRAERWQGSTGQPGAQRWSAVHHQDERTRPHGRVEPSERIVLMSIDGDKPSFGLSFALDSPPPIIPVPSRQRSGRQDGSSRASRFHACDTQGVAIEAHYDGNACGLLRIKRMSAFCPSPHRPVDAGRASHGKELQEAARRRPPWLSTAPRRQATHCPVCPGSGPTRWGNRERNDSAYRLLSFSSLCI